MKTANFSLKSLKLGAIESDGTMSQSLTTFDDPVRDTCVLSMPDGTTQDFFTEVDDNPYYSTVTPGKVTLKADFYAKSASQLQTVFGGTSTAESGDTPEGWDAPASQVTIEKSIELTHKNGSKISIVRALITASFDWNFKRGSLPLIHLTGTVLAPIDPTTGDKLDISPFKYTGQPTD